MCSRRRNCGSSWSYSWSSGPTSVQYYYPTKQSCPQQSGGGGNVSSSGGGSKGGPPVSASDFDGDYHEYGLYLHNWYRKHHGSPAMTLVDRLNSAGDNYCHKLAGMRTLQHSSGLDYNENLYMSTDTSISKKEHVRKACELWYNEIKLYNFNNPGFSMQTGHFTAMVWKGVTQLGIGCWTQNGCTVVAGCYKPHANMQGQFGNNVLPWREVEEEKKKEVKKEEVKVEKKVEKEEKKEESESEEDEEWTDDEVSEELKAAFDAKAKAGTIGWSELNEILNENVKVTFKFDGFDKILSSLLISLATYRKGETDRIGLEELDAILEAIATVLDAYSEFDRDGSGTLDPFELKDALAEAGFNISYKTFLTLQKLFGDAEKNVMNFRGYFLCHVLLSKLQIFQQKKTKSLLEDFSMKEWMQEQIDAVS